MTADTVPVGPMSKAPNLQATECTNASGDVSQTQLIGGEAHSPTDPGSPCTESCQTPALTTNVVLDSRVSTSSRGGTADLVADVGILEGAERTKCALKEKAEAIACTRACWILHPDAGDDIVAEGRAGGSWKAQHKNLDICAVLVIRWCKCTECFMGVTAYSTQKSATQASPL